MKKILILVFTSILFLGYSQSKKINILIMVDESPCLIVNDFSIETESMSAINPKYVVGTVDFTQNDYEKLISDTSPEFKLSFQTVLPKFLSIVNYNLAFKKDILKQEYVIIDIFNMNIKKYKKKYSKLIKNNKEYYVVIKTPNYMIFD